jgi:hypothetical protein
MPVIRSVLGGNVNIMDFSNELAQSDISRVPSYRLVGILGTSGTDQYTKTMEKVKAELARRKISFVSEEWYKYLKIYRMKYAPDNDRFMDESCVYVHPDLPHSRYKKVGN